MEFKDLRGMKVAILATHMFEEAELIDPRKALDEAGADTHLISIKAGDIVSANHFDKSKKYDVDATFDEISATDYDAVLLPGGAMNADFIRVDPQAQRFVQEIDEAGKPIAFICHAPWLLISAGLVDKRKLTSFHTIADDIRNAGGTWLDQAVVVDDNWVSSRQPSDIPLFNEAMLKLFAEAYHLLPAM